MSFQTKINRDLPRAVAGDFASTNPRYSILAGEGALRTAEAIIVGAFAFADLDTGLVHAEHDAGRVVGFVHRNNQAVVHVGGATSMLVPTGKETALFSKGDFYAVFGTDVTVGDAVYALDADGTPVITDGADPDDTPPVPANAQATHYKVAHSAKAGELVKITADAI